MFTLQLLDLKIIRGPNPWSDDDKQLIVLNLTAREIKDTTDLKKIKNTLTDIFPSLKKEFFNKSFDQLMYDSVAYVSRELQIRAGIECEYVRTQHSKNKNECYIIFPFEMEIPASQAAKWAMKIINAIAAGEKYKNIDNDVKRLNALKSKYYLGATTSYLIRNARRAGVPCRQFHNSPLIIFGYGNNQRKIITSSGDSTGGFGIEMALDTEEVKKILAEDLIPLPHDITIKSETELLGKVQELSYPLILKPVNKNRKKGISMRVNNREELLSYFESMRKISRTMIVEEFIDGENYRLLVVNNKFIAAARKLPATIKGNGLSTIKQLIDKENKNVLRGHGDEFALVPIQIDEITKKVLSEKGYSPDTVLSRGEKLVLKQTASIRYGGTAEDVTDIVHPENKLLAEKISRMFNLDICGLDIISKNIEKPLDKKIGAVTGVNANPGLRVHLSPQRGSSRNVAEPIVRMLFPENRNPRIRIVSIAETEGADAIARLISHFAELAWYRSGFNTTDGVYIQGKTISKGNCIAYKNVQQVLFDQSTDFAVLQSSDKSIFDSGLAFDLCDVSIISGFSEKNFKSDGYSLVEAEMMSRSVLINSTKKNGFTVLNADIDLLDKFQKTAKCNVALFSADNKNQKLASHFKKGGLGATVEQDKIMIYDHGKSIPIMETKSIPFSVNGDKSDTFKIILPAVLASIEAGLNLNSIRDGLKSFKLKKKLTDITR